MDHLQIGQIIKYPQQKDAIHMAIAPIEAGNRLSPGQRVIIQADGKAYSPLTGFPEVGIVDPFLTVMVNPGEQFWLFLFPGSIQSIRHDWTHPSFPQQASAINLEARDWLSSFATSHGRTFEEIMFAAEEGWVPEEGISVPDEFWIFYKLYTGRDGLKTDYFSCSC